MDPQKTYRESGGQGGFALILALMVLVLLTFLGLTLATSTSTELQIATNFRWRQAAFYNAEAGVEVARAILRTADWNLLLPAPRTNVSWTVATGPSSGSVPTWTRNSPLPAGAASTQNGWNVSSAARDWENGPCDKRFGSQGYGVVLDDGTQKYQYVSNVFGQNLNGAFTVWVRRETKENANGVRSDDSANDQLTLTSEGIAPYTAATIGSALAQTNRAVRVVELTITRRVDAAATICGTRTGQGGGGEGGSGFHGCEALTSIDGAGGLAGAGGGQSVSR